MAADRVGRVARRHNAPLALRRDAEETAVRVERDGEGVLLRDGCHVVLRFKFRPVRFARNQHGAE